jgi:hypothetical protein
MSADSVVSSEKRSPRKEIAPTNSAIAARTGATEAKSIETRNSPSVCSTLFLIIAELDVAQDWFPMGLKLLNFVSVALLAI